jgi:hypothetical protein
MIALLHMHRCVASPCLPKVICTAAEEALMAMFPMPLAKHLPGPWLGYLSLSKLQLQDLLAPFMACLTIWALATAQSHHPGEQVKRKMMSTAWESHPQDTIGTAGEKPERWEPHRPSGTSAREILSVTMATILTLWGNEDPPHVVLWHSEQLH